MIRRLAISLALALVFSTGGQAAADLLPANFINVNFAPIRSSTSFNYDWSTGEMSPSTAVASVSSTANAIEAAVADPAPPDPNGFGTFIGTAHPERFDGDTVVYEQSVCPSYPLCFFDGSFTAGYFVLYNTRGRTLDQLITLATNYYIQTGDCGGGSPRFSVAMSNAVNKGKQVHVYIGPSPNFTGCPVQSWQTTGNFATDAAGLRWDTSQINGTFYSTYSAAVLLANAQGYTIDEIFLGTDGGWAMAGGVQTILFRNIQANNTTRFPTK